LYATMLADKRIQMPAADTQRHLLSARGPAYLAR
jgi:hypothetical protein